MFKCRIIVMATKTAMLGWNIFGLTATREKTLCNLILFINKSKISSQLFNNKRKINSDKMITVGDRIFETLVFFNFSAKDASNLKISELNYTSLHCPTTV